MHNTALYRLVLCNLRLLLRLVHLSSQEFLNLKLSLLLINTKLLKKCIVILFEKAFEHLKLNHIIVILRILRLDITYLRNGNAFKLFIKFLHFTLKICQSFIAGLVYAQETFSLLVESDEFVTESEGSTTSWLVPRWNVWFIGGLQNIWRDKRSSWIRVKTLWLKGKDGTVSITGHSTNFTMLLIAPSDLLVRLFGWELEHLLSRLEVGNDCAVILTSTDNQAWIR